MPTGFSTAIALTRVRDYQ